MEMRSEFVTIERATGREVPDEELEAGTEGEVKFDGIELASFYRCECGKRIDCEMSPEVGAIYQGDSGRPYHTKCGAGHAHTLYPGNG